MVPGLRKAYNESFTDKQYEAFLKDLNSKYPGAIQFRLAETPVFVDKQFAGQMIEACEHIIDVITDPSFKQYTEPAIPPGEHVPNESDHCELLCFDFGVCLNDEQQPEPRLIEMQGFPTLFGFQVFYPDLLRKYFPVPENYSQYMNGHTRETYLQLLKEVITGDVPVENTILLEIKPHEQKTRIDFYCTQDYLGIQPVCITELIQEGKDLYYMRDGKKTAIKRIYNRVIFDELRAKKDTLGHFTDITQELNVQWVPHPNWFYRISKYTLPFLHHPYIPATYFLNEIKQIPADLENYVLKPLFSFAGQGVVIDVTPADIEKIDDPQNWILQRKVQYADIIETPDVPAKAEIRIMYVWKKGWERPQPVINLARLSKGKMIGVSYNKDKQWVGGSVAFIER
ncbi:hypothetical protein A3860_28700 [Niastella vici]|uniref:Glutathionylspermidine synthase pre-ATP-grasp-like domain-containing protein n=1 Tax=Niastella vici TaxID=1703345 RepID=A0A1V9FVH0_9BACT|nr:hypothetical protein [Niastella vici]OQP62343.1 hypothetical protein A3860_28700 [Niastella vici]